MAIFKFYLSGTVRQVLMSIPALHTTFTAISPYVLSMYLVGICINVYEWIFFCEERDFEVRNMIYLTYCIYTSIRI